MSRSAASRLIRDYQQLLKDPVPYVKAHPSQTNMLQWHYAVTGPPDSPYEGGIYHGMLFFPEEYPFKPPGICMITPNGRFAVKTRLCLSISDYHPDTWNPSWSVSTILAGLLSFMLDSIPTTGSVLTTVHTKRELAVKSWSFNLQNPTFCKLFPDLVAECEEKIAKRKPEHTRGYSYCGIL